MARRPKWVKLNQVKGAKAARLRQRKHELIQRFNIPDGAMGVKPFIYKDSVATKAGLRASHMITAVNGQSPNVVGRSFEWWFRSTFNPGDEISLTVLEAPGKSKEIKFVLPKD